MKNFALIGKRLDYSFSKDYFGQKFEREKINARYQNVELDNLDELKKIVEKNKISGLNITVPYKKKIISLLDGITPIAKSANAVNCIKILASGKWVGHNTDIEGFEKSLLHFLKKEHPAAIIFGTGGASQAVQFALSKLNIAFLTVSRKTSSDQLCYEDLNAKIISAHKLLINTTPLGTFPNITECINIPFEFITLQHYCYDLIYNPEQTEFLKRCSKQGAQTKNGLQMLEQQADASWDFWNEYE